jgi:hypothetical protein
VKIFTAQDAPTVSNDTGGKWKQSSISGVLNISLDTCGKKGPHIDKFFSSLRCNQLDI